MTRLSAALLATTIALCGSAASLPAQAQDAPRPPPMMGERGPGMMGPGVMGQQRHGGWMRRMREFALIYPASDRNLSGPDVQKIAEAFLLFNGNHSWKVTEVAEEPSRVTFAFATPEGGVIARFAMDRHTARPERLG